MPTPPATAARIRGGTPTTGDALWWRCAWRPWTGRMASEEWRLGFNRGRGEWAPGRRRGAGSRGGEEAGSDAQERERGG